MAFKKGTGYTPIQKNMMTRGMRVMASRRLRSDSPRCFSWTTVPNMVR